MRSYIGRSDAAHGPASCTRSNSEAAPVTHPGTRSSQAPSPRNRRRAPRNVGSNAGSTESSNVGCHVTATRVMLAEHTFVAKRRPWRANMPAMIRMSVFYPTTEGESFDHDYYVSKHLPLLREKLGDALKNVTAQKGTDNGMGGEPPFVAIAHLDFESAEEFQAAFMPVA